MAEIFIFVVMTAVIYAFVVWRKKQAQLAYIENYQFHPAIAGKVKSKYPHLTDAQVALVFSGLREYFYACNKANRKIVSMPSQVVDVAWHEFILFTRAYQQFCTKSLGRFLHHTPTEAMRSPTLAQEGIKRAWRIACAKHKIDPKKPTRLPLLFALDSQLNIDDGFSYALDCQSLSGNSKPGDYCAGHIGCASGCSGCGGDSGCGGCGGD